MAGCLPQEQVASLAQMQPPSRPQQVAGTAAVAVDMSMCGVVHWLAESVSVDVNGDTML